MWDLSTVETIFLWNLSASWKINNPSLRDLEKLWYILENQYAQGLVATPRAWNAKSQATVRPEIQQIQKAHAENWWRAVSQHFRDLYLEVEILEHHMFDVWDFQLIICVLRHWITN